jgi:hypothetical protein
MRLKKIYIVTERDNYGMQLFKGAFLKKKHAKKHLKEQGLTESNIDEITKIEF